MARRRDAITKRRTQVDDLMLSHATQRQIRTQLGVSVATSNRDIQMICAEWRIERLRDAAKHITDEVVPLATAEAAIWPDVLAGKVQAIDRLLAIVDSRAKYLGLNAWTKTRANCTIKAEYSDAWQPAAADRNIALVGSPS